MRIRTLCRNLFRRRTVESEITDEVSFGFELLVEEHMRRGCSRNEAQRQARLEFGDVETTKDAVRDARTGAWVDGWIRDVRHAWRNLRRSPLFALTAVFSLAIGIASNTVVVSIANALLFSTPPGVTEPGRLVELTRGGGSGPALQHSYPDYLDIRRDTTTLAAAYASQLVGQPASLLVDRTAETVLVKAVSTNYFDALGVVPALGRVLHASDGEAPGDSPYAVMSDAYWTRRFNADPAVIGRPLQINGRLLTVVGVTQSGFQGTNISTTDLWIPIGQISDPADTASLLAGRDVTAFAVGARLKADVTMTVANAELVTIGQRLDQQFSDGSTPRGFRLTSASMLPKAFAPSVSAFLALLGAITLTVLTIACVNLAGLLLARATARAQEIAVRMAIGATRRQIAQQLLTETVLLFLIGAGAGLGLAEALLPVAMSVLPPLPVAVSVAPHLDGSVIAMMLALALLAALGAGLSPALRAGRESIGALHNRSSGSAAPQRQRRLFVIAQVSLSVLLVVTSALLLRGLARAAAVDAGFDPTDVELASVDLSLGQFSKSTGAAFARDLVSVVREAPGVAAASVASTPQVSDGIRTVSVGHPGDVLTSRSTTYARWAVMEPAYFSTMRIPILAGRDFTDADSDHAGSVAIVSQSLARRLWPDSQGIGQTLVVQESRPGRVSEKAVPQQVQIVGVVGDVSLPDGGAAAKLSVYVPLQQHYTPTVSIVVRAKAGGIAPDIRGVVNAIDSTLPVFSTRMLKDALRIATLPQSIAAAVAGSLGLVGLVLAGIGIYGVTAYLVSRRTREIGVRVALGATGMDVARLVTHEGMTLVAVGSAVGLVLSAFAARALEGFLIGLRVADMAAAASTILLFAILGLLACLVPTIRALRIPATDALRAL